MGRNRAAIFGSIVTPPRSATTLMELMLALSLGAMLSLALIGVLRSLSLQLSVARQQAQLPDQERIMQQLRRDLMCSSQISSREGWLWLDGNFTSAVSDSGFTKRLGYGCVEWLNGQKAFVRQAGSRTDLLAIGVNRFTCERVDRAGAPQPISAQPGSMPDRVRVWFWSNENSAPDSTFDVLVW